MSSSTEPFTSQPKPRGIIRGGPNPGGFKKGDDPRRAGGMRVYDGQTLAQMARQRGPKCIELWERAIDDEDLPWPVRLRASELMMDRGYGKAVSVIETHSRPLESLSNEELEAIAAGQAPRLPITLQGEAVAVPLAVNLAVSGDE